MFLRITTLAENSVAFGKSGLLGEHGLSLLVEMDDLCLLLDTGQTGTAVHNAHALGIDLSRVQYIVLSHGHHDHTGGLKEVLSQTGEVEVFAHPEVFKARYSVREGEKTRYSGFPFLRDHLETLGAQFHLSGGGLAIDPNLTVTGQIPRKADFESVPENLKVRTPRGWETDPILDDQALLVETPRGLVVLLGCAHAGMVNTVLHARQLTGEKRVLAIMGGTHLISAKPLQMDKTIAALKEFGVEKLGVSHCTGLPAAARLAQEFGDRFFFNNVGTVTEWEL